MKTEKNINKVVHISEDNEIKVLRSLFIHSDDFKGATGATFYPVSKKEYKERIKKSNVIEYLKGCFSDNEMKGKGGINKLYNNIKNAGEIDSVMFDDSFNSELDTELRIYFPDAVLFDCVGCGRMFDNDFQGNINSELSAMIREYESK